jgi:MscS family membrane protein
VGRILRIAIVCLIAMITFQELGINVAGLIAGLGVGGLALALAAKDTVANWFGALMVYTDRPFEMGDTITVAGITGTVEDLGLRSTRIRTSDKTLVTLPNSTLTGAHIENLSWRTKRKGTNNVALAVGTRPDEVRAVIGAIQAILERTEGVEQGTHDVKLAEVTSTELTLMVQYFTESAAWDEFLRVREAVHLSVLEELEALGVALAVPTTALKVDGSPPALG